MATFADISAEDLLLTTSPNTHGAFLDDATAVLQVKRTFKSVVKTGTGTGDMRPFGEHTFAGNTSVRIVIDFAGSVPALLDGDGNPIVPTFKWSIDGGASFVQTGVPLTYLSRTLMQSGLYALFAFGTYDLNDRWDFTAIGTANQLYDLLVDTTNSIVKVGTTIQFGNDANFRMQILGGLPALVVDTGDQLTFDRGQNKLAWFIGGAEVVAIWPNYLDMGVTPLRFETISTPSTPASGSGKLFAKGGASVVRPWWLNAAGTESSIPLTALAETIAGAWTFTGGPVFSAVAPRFDIEPWINTTMLLTSTVTPATPAASRGRLYSKEATAAPFWLDSGGTESQLAQLLKAETVSGAWTFTAAATFSAAGTAISVTNSISVGGNLSALQALVTNVRFTSALDPGDTTRIGLATSAPNVTLTGTSYAVQPTLGNEVFRFQSTATNDDPVESVFQNRVATTDATVTTLHTFTIPASTTVRIVAAIVARRTGGTAGTAEDGASYSRGAVVKNVAGTATLIGAVIALDTNEDQVLWDCTIDVTGATARIRVTGAALNNVTWHATSHVYSVGS